MAVCAKGRPTFLSTVESFVDPFFDDDEDDGVSGLGMKVKSFETLVVW